MQCKKNLKKPISLQLGAAVNNNAQLNKMI